jgi:hypothetical protein
MTTPNPDEFFAFINERHRIYVRKSRGKLWPWTTDPVLRTYKFTNVYRDLDAVSLDLKRRVLDRYLPWRKQDAAALVAEVIMYRLFNWPDTYTLLRKLRHDWDQEKAKRILHRAHDEGAQVFTGAYICSNNGSTQPKIDLYCEAVSDAFKRAPELVAAIRTSRSLRHTTQWIADNLDLCGMFVAYEIVSDLRWTPLLNNAADIMAWANPGPGATRGLNRIHYRPLRAKPTAQQLVDEMRALLTESQRAGRLGKHMRPLEMRDVEHSLCELDKYLRVKNDEGRPRSKYRAPAETHAA